MIIGKTSVEWHRDNKEYIQLYCAIYELFLIRMIYVIFVE